MYSCSISRFVTSISIVTIFASCTTTKDSILLGVGIGSVVGAGVGAAAGQNNSVPREGAAVGLAVGAALGGLMGYLKHKESDAEKLKLSSVGPSGSVPPSITQPRIERVWVPARIENNVYIEGHYQYVIEQPSRWSPGSDESPTSKTKGRSK